MNENGKKLYEVSFLARSENGAAVMVEHLTRAGAEIVNEGEIKSIQLAYPIEKQESAYFGCITCAMPTDAVAGIHDAVRLDKDILRLLIVAPIPVKEKNERPYGGGSAPDTSGRASQEETPSMKEKADERGMVSNEALEEKLEEILQ